MKSKSTFRKEVLFLSTSDFSASIINLSLFKPAPENLLYRSIIRSASHKINSERVGMTFNPLRLYSRRIEFESRPVYWLSYQQKEYCMEEIVTSECIWQSN